MKLARANQHPPVHQLAVLFIGWAAFLHPLLDPVLTQHSTTVNLFGLLTFDLFFCVWFFSNPDHTTFQPNHPSYPTDLATLLTCILALPINPLPIYLLLFMAKNLYLLAKLLPFGTTYSNSFWLNLYFLVRPFPFGTTFNSSWLNFYFLAFFFFGHNF